MMIGQHLGVVVLAGLSEGQVLPLKGKLVGLVGGIACR